MPHLFIVVVDTLMTCGNFPCSTLIFSWAAELVLIYCIPLPTYVTPTSWGYLGGGKQEAYCNESNYSNHPII